MLKQVQEGARVEGSVDQMDEGALAAVAQFSDELRAMASEEPGVHEQPEPGVQGDYDYDAQPQPGDSEVVTRRLSAISAKKRAAEQENAQMREKMHQMEVAMARLQGHAQPDAPAQDEYIPVGFGDAPEGIEEPLWRELERRSVTATLENARAIAEQMIAPVMQQMEALRSGVTNQETREGRRMIDGILSDAMTKYPAIKSEKARGFLETAMQGQFAGQPFDAAKVRQFVMDNAALLAGVQAHVPGRPPMTPYGAPMPGFRGAGAMRPQRAPQTWEEATHGLKEAVTFDDVWKRR